MPLRDVAVGRVLLAGGGIAATVVGVVALVVAGLAWWGVPPDGARSVVPVRHAEGPAMQAAPQADLAAERAREARALNETAWVDRAAGLARIPVAEAMALMAERGLRAAPAASGVRP